MATRRMRSGTAAARGASAPAKGFTEAQAGGYSRTAYKIKKETVDETDQQLSTGTVRIPEGVKPAYVKVGAGLTISMGNFESLRVDVSISMPCMPTEQAINDAYETVSQMVADKVADEQERWLPGGRGK